MTTVGFEITKTIDFETNYTNYTIGNFSLTFKKRYRGKKIEKMIALTDEFGTGKTVLHGKDRSTPSDSIFGIKKNTRTRHCKKTYNVHFSLGI